MFEPDIEDGATVDLYASLIRVVKKIEKTGEITMDDVSDIDHKCWIWMQEREEERE
jgi:hypothetical protein